MCKMVSEKTGDTERRLRLLGLCARAGKLVFGTQMVCEGLSCKVLFVVMSDGASENTKKRLRDKCGFYDVPLRELALSSDSLAHAVGKKGEIAAVGVTDRNFADGLGSLWN